MPSKQVIINLILVLSEFFIKIEWWHHVTETPELIKISVFRSGTFMGLKGLVDEGGQFCPISIFGLTLEWKYDQKKLMKNNTSDVINKIMPIFNPFITIFWCIPSFLASLDVFFHQYIEDSTNIRVNNMLFLDILAIRFLVVFIIIFHNWIEHINGQGLRVIIWNWWNLFII